jgi:D-alanyl-D-alanine carboxypeptidase/D-alanyl-D-alanine-endopeptidase (penicillin-binding protein 4)
MVMRRVLPVLLVVLLTAVAAGGDSSTRLLYFAVDGAGKKVLSDEPDLPFNPASVIKVATSFLALERLGPDHRYETRLLCQGECTVADGVLSGDLVLAGGADPDFQTENAWLMAETLNDIGVRTVTGDLFIEDVFWMGWERGAERRVTDTGRRVALMGDRLLKVWNPPADDRTLADHWKVFAERTGRGDARAPVVRVRGRVKPSTGRAELAQPVLTHRSSPLPVILKRFNTYSNNDIVRIAEPFGGAPTLEMFLRALTGGTAGTVEVATASGEGINRMTARQVVRLLRAFDDACRKHGLELDEVLPVPGCDPGPLARMFPRLASGEGARTTVVKTGTLRTTDGGVAVLAGWFDTPGRGRVVYCVAAPRAGDALRRWRLTEQNWLMDLMTLAGGARRIQCRGELPFSEAFAEVTAHRVFREES